MDTISRRNERSLAQIWCLIKVDRRGLSRVRFSGRRREAALHPQNSTLSGKPIKLIDGSIEKVFFFVSSVANGTSVVRTCLIHCIDLLTANTHSALRLAFFFAYHHRR